MASASWRDAHRKGWVKGTREERAAYTVRDGRECPGWVSIDPELTCMICGQYRKDHPAHRQGSVL